MIKLGNRKFNLYKIDINPGDEIRDITVLDRTKIIRIHYYIFSDNQKDIEKLENAYLHIEDISYSSMGHNTIMSSPLNLFRCIDKLDIFFQQGRMKLRILNSVRQQATINLYIEESPIVCDRCNREYD